MSARGSLISEQRLDGISNQESGQSRKSVSIQGSRRNSKNVSIRFSEQETKISQDHTDIIQESSDTSSKGRDEQYEEDDAPVTEEVNDLIEEFRSLSVRSSSRRKRTEITFQLPTKTIRESEAPQQRVTRWLLVCSNQDCLLAGVLEALMFDQNLLSRIKKSF